ncbi:DoxX family protein [Oleiagrimonas sp. C23AA]|uniref:DoxX family protein n=1 Tax=Oleiagrimonas sp. C23AA TaxID=2719047 RepID=UPI00142406E1|nr:DoxX family protein [Oleiagrimonas sp. C23AA]NII11340.1 DoxX family protein [Oleiagrimonas sp. C23AA]
MPDATSFKTPLRAWQRATGAAAGLAPWCLLAMRVLVALAFWRAGSVKLADPSGTLYLFTDEYHVPWLAPGFAAALATWTELVLPWFLGLGAATRLVAVVLFVYNIICVVSYPALWPMGFWRGLAHGQFADHQAWALMLLAVIAWGPGRWSLDTLLARWWQRRTT